MNTVEDCKAAARQAVSCCQADELPPARRRLVQRIRAEIAAGTYETPERLEIAVERLLEELKAS